MNEYQWPLKPCLPSRDDGGSLYCITHSHSSRFYGKAVYPRESVKGLVGWELPHENIQCYQAIKLTAFAADVRSDFIHRLQEAGEFLRKGGEYWDQYNAGWDDALDVLETHVIRAVYT